MFNKDVLFFNGIKYHFIHQVQTYPNIAEQQSLLSYCDEVFHDRGSILGSH